jgi:hypothetical protein
VRTRVLSFLFFHDALVVVTCACLSPGDAPFDVFLLVILQAPCTAPVHSYLPSIVSRRQDARWCLVWLADITL